MNEWRNVSLRLRNLNKLPALTSSSIIPFRTRLVTIGARKPQGTNTLARAGVTSSVSLTLTRLTAVSTPIPLRAVLLTRRCHKHSGRYIILVTLVTVVWDLASRTLTLTRHVVTRWARWALTAIAASLAVRAKRAVLLTVDTKPTGWTRADS